eukprot:jgi/Picre1/30392/NNA_005756.t1
MSTPFVDPKTTLKDGEGKEISAASLWTDSPALVVVLPPRMPSLSRPGDRFVEEQRDHCKLCTRHRQTAYKNELYHDETKAFYKAVHGGQVKKGSLASFLNPFSRAWKNYRAVKARGAVCDSNLEGDGLTLGGLAVLDSPAGNSVYVFKEETFGDHAPMASVMKAVASLMANKHFHLMNTIMNDVDRTRIFALFVGALFVKPHELPRLARQAGRIAGRAATKLQRIRREISEYVDKNEMNSVHEELQDTVAQLDKIRRDVRSMSSLKGMICQKTWARRLVLVCRHLLLFKRILRVANKTILHHIR